MKIIYYSPYRLGSSSFGICLDDALTQINSSEENEVLFLTCSGEIEACNTNLEASNIKCFQCKTCSNLLIKRYKHERLSTNNLSYYKSRSTFNKEFNLNDAYISLEELKRYKFKDINLGYGVVSSYVSETRNINPKLNEANKDILNSLLTGAAYSLEAFSIACERFKPDEIRLFNGRFSDIRPMFEFGKKNNIDVVCLEYVHGNSIEDVRKVEFRNCLPHNIDANTELINKHWENGGSNRKEVGEKFFYNRKNKIFSGDKIYVKDQEESKLPDSWDSNKRNFVIFNSSEDEFFSIGEEWDNKMVFKSQIEGIKYISKFLNNYDNTHLYLRIHPNLSGLDFNYVSELERLSISFANLTVIPAESNVSTYGLIDNCEKCIVFGSTVGVEANFWRKPVILLGGSFYLNLNVAYYPENLDDLNHLLESNIKPKPKINSIKYGYYILDNDRGEDYTYVNFNYEIINYLGKKIKNPLYIKNYIYKLILLLSIIDYKKIVTWFKRDRISEERSAE